MKRKIIAMAMSAVILGGSLVTSVAAMKVFVKVGDKSIEMEMPDELVSQLIKQHQIDQKIQLANEQKVQEQIKQDKINLIKLKLKELELIAEELQSRNKYKFEQISLFKEQVYITETEKKEVKSKQTECQTAINNLRENIKKLEDQSQLIKTELSEKDKEIINLKNQIEYQQRKDKNITKMIEDLEDAVKKLEATKKIETNVEKPIDLINNKLHPNVVEKENFKITVYGKSMRIDIPEIDEGKNYKIYMSISNNLDIEDLNKDVRKKCVLESDDYKSHVYINDNRDLEIKPNTDYYFYLIVNDSLCKIVDVKTTKNSVCWTDKGNYDTSWYVKNTTDFNITTEKELAGLAYLINHGITDFEDKTIHLKNSLNMSDYEWEPIYVNDENKRFRGIFDGECHIVKGIYVNKFHRIAGLFGCNHGTIKNVGVVDGYIIGQDSAGGIVGKNIGCVENCYNSCLINGGSYGVGGIVGRNEGGTVTTSCNAGLICGYSSTGGIVGDNGYNGNVTTSYNFGNIKSSQYQAGGVVGHSFNGGKLTKSYSVGSVVGGHHGSGFGTGGGETTNCYYNKDKSVKANSEKEINHIGLGKTTEEMKNVENLLELRDEFINSPDPTFNEGYPIVASQIGFIEELKLLKILKK